MDYYGFGTAAEESRGAAVDRVLINAEKLLNALMERAGLPAEVTAGVWSTIMNASEGWLESGDEERISAVLKAAEVTPCA